MKKKLLTIFAVLALVVAMVFSVVACGDKPKGPVTPPPDVPDEPDVDLSKLASESATAMKDGILGLMRTALDSSNDKSYDATIFVKVKVGEGEDATDVDVKLRVAATFGSKNSGLVDVTVGGTSYLTLYTADNMVYVGEALTQADKNWFKIDAMKDGAVVDKFFPELVSMFNEKEDSNGDNLYQKVNSKISTYFSLVPMICGILFVQNQQDGIVKEELAGGAVRYTNNVTFARVQELLSAVSGPPLYLDIEELLSGLGDFQGLIDTVCNIIFGGTLNQLLGKDGASIPAGAAPSIQLNYTTKSNQLTDLEIKYAKDIAFDKEKPDEKTAIAVAFGFENVNVTTNSSTDIMKGSVQTADISAAKEPAIKLTIDAEVPGKEVGATVEAYVVPKVALATQVYYSVPTKYAQTYYTTDKVKTPKLIEPKQHKCKDNCVHTLGEVKGMEKDHKCAMPDGNCVHSDYQGGLVETGHKCLNSKCKHYNNLDKFNFANVEAYAIAKNSKGDVVNLACDVDATELKDDGNGEIVLRFELAGLYELLGIENTNELPTSYQKTFKMWDDDEVEEPEGGDDPAEEPNKPAEEPAKPEGEKEEVKLPDNLIDKVVTIFSNGLGFGKIVGLLNPALDFVKGIYNDVLQPNFVKGEEGTKTATLNVAAILKGLVANDTIKGSENLNINKEKHLTTYLANLQGVADLVDNIMRHTDPNKKDVKEGEAYTKEELVALVKKYAGIDITDTAFENTTLELKGIRGDKTADDGIGFTAELKSEGKTVITLTMKVDIIDAATAPGQTVIGDKFEGAELVKVPDIDETTGEQKVDKDGNLLYKDGDALNDINALAKEILKAYEEKVKAAA